MTFKDIIKTNKEVFIAIVNNFLDTLYNADEQNSSAPLYEELRHSLIDEIDLTLVQQRLLLLLVTFYLEQTKKMIKVHTEMAESLTTIKSNLEQILK